MDDFHLLHNGRLSTLPRSYESTVSVCCGSSKLCHTYQGVGFYIPAVTCANLARVPCLWPDFSSSAHYPRSTLPCFHTHPCRIKGEVKAQRQRGRCRCSAGCGCSCTGSYTGCSLCSRPVVSGDSNWRRDTGRDRGRGAGWNNRESRWRSLKCRGVGGYSGGRLHGEVDDDE